MKLQCFGQDAHLSGVRGSSLISRILLVVILIIFVAHLLGSLHHWYWRIPWFDIPMHILGGAWLALLFFYLFDERWKLLPSHSGSLAIFLWVLGFVMLVGVFWEYYEYAYDTLIARKYPFTEAQARGHFDTLKDLFNDLVGATVVSLWILFRKRLD